MNINNQNKLSFILFITITFNMISVNGIEFIERNKCAFQMCKYHQYECYLDSLCISEMQRFERCQIERTNMLSSCTPLSSMKVAREFADCLSNNCGYDQLYSVKKVENAYINCSKNNTCTNQYDLFLNRTNSLQGCYNNTITTCQQQNNSTNVYTFSMHSCLQQGYYSCDYTVTPYRDLETTNPARQYFLYKYATTFYDFTHSIVLSITIPILIIQLFIY